ncbi:hypothetical protein [Acidocella facilis]|uniref:hypothetical protein n=1 Tax=Acidocella facilis TaxID=525 RepID=UPI001F2D3A90|nr:hypothetical protein [Acidocella facilis]
MKEIHDGSSINAAGRAEYVEPVEREESIWERAISPPRFGDLQAEVDARARARLLGAPEKSQEIN